MLTRRAFGLSFLSLFFVRPGRVAAAGRVEATPVMDVAIAGGRFHALKARRAGLPVGRLLSLAREPQNPYDPNAVALLDEDGTRLGYVPRAAAGRVAALLDEGTRLSARIVGTLPDRVGDFPEDVVFTDPFPGDPRIRLEIQA